MNDLTPETIAELRRLAEAATPGPWASGDPTFGDGNAQCIVSISEHAMGRDIQGPTLCPALSDVEFIAAANPAVVLALLDERDTLTAKVERVRALHKSSGNAETQGYTGLKYGYISPYCMGEVASDEYGVPWPCETIRAIDGGES